MKHESELISPVAVIARLKEQINLMQQAKTLWPLDWTHLHAMVNTVVADLTTALGEKEQENVALRENNRNVKELFDGKCLGIAQAWAREAELKAQLEQAEAALVAVTQALRSVLEDCTCEFRDCAIHDKARAALAGIGITGPQRPDETP